MTKIKRVEIILDDGTVMIAGGDNVTLFEMEGDAEPSPTPPWWIATVKIAGAFRLLKQITFESTAEDPKGINRDVTDLLKQIKVSVKK